MSKKRILIIFAIAFASCMSSIISSKATTVTYAGFSSTAGLTLVGNASVVSTTDGNVVRLTPASMSQSGAVYSTSPISLGANEIFSTGFSFRFTNPGPAASADGITFMLAASPNGLGSVGGGLGYEGVGNSVAIEFDTWNNGPSDGNSDNHVAIDTNGILTDTNVVYPYGVQNCNSSGFGCMSNGDLWHATIGYNGTALSVYLQDGTANIDTIMSNYPINIASYLGTTNAYLGLTGGTGGGYENQDIVAWSYSNTTQILQQTEIPEPSALLLILAGIVILFVVIRFTKFDGKSEDNDATL